MKRELSIIIPCYNVEKYIEKCLSSITKQLDDFKYEIILVDDCSKDNTNKIIKKLLKKYKNIVFIENKENMGAGASRNKAIKQAKYDIISFIDADDYLDDNFYEELYTTMEKEEADLVACDITMVYPDIDKKEDYKACEFVPSKYNLINNGLAASPCNKLIKKEYFIKYPFAEGIMNEDVATILPIIANCKKVAYTDETKYYYLQHSSSVQNARLSDKRLDIIEAYKVFESRIKGNKEYSDFTNVVMFNQIISFLLYVPIKEKDVKRRAKFLNEFGKRSKDLNLRQNRLYWNFIDGSSKKTKLFYKTYVRLVCKGHGTLASLWLASYDVYKKFRKNHSVIKQNITMDDLIKAAKKNQTYKSDKTLTVAVPNYNYEDFLYQRIYSILYQKYKIDRLVILDDCSKDNSRKLIDEIVKKLSPYMNVEKDYNEVNSGSTFKQWRKILESCNSDYLWIAEADDYCKNTMVSSLMKYINKNDNIRIAYVDTAFINKEGSIILKTIKPEIDIMKTGHWDHDFIDDGKEEIKNYAFVNCTIANVSSVLFKVDDYSRIFDEMVNYKQVGDYLFYLSVMEKGDICFVNKPLNFYRVHGNNVTTKTKKQLHFDELKRVHKLLDKKYKFNKKQQKEIEKRYKFLRKVWNVE